MHLQKNILKCINNKNTTEHVSSVVIKIYKLINFKLLFIKITIRLQKCFKY